VLRKQSFWLGECYTCIEITFDGWNKLYAISKCVSLDFGAFFFKLIFFADLAKNVVILTTRNINPAVNTHFHTVKFSRFEILKEQTEIG